MHPIYNWSFQKQSSRTESFNNLFINFSEESDVESEISQVTQELETATCGSGEIGAGFYKFTKF